MSIRKPENDTKQACQTESSKVLLAAIAKNICRIGDLIAFGITIVTGVQLRGP